MMGTFQRQTLPQAPGSDQIQYFHVYPLRCIALKALLIKDYNKIPKEIYSELDCDDKAKACW
jgi:hypothetical protein